MQHHTKTRRSRGVLLWENFQPLRFLLRPYYTRCKAGVSNLLLCKVIAYHLIIMANITNFFWGGGGGGYQDAPPSVLIPAYVT